MGFHRFQHSEASNAEHLPYHLRHIPFPLIRFCIVGIGQDKIIRFRRFKGKDEKVPLCVIRNHGGWQEGGAPAFLQEIPGHDMIVHLIDPVQGNVVLGKDLILNPAGIGPAF